MSRVTLSLLVLLVTQLGVPFGAFGGDDPQMGREAAAAMRALAEKIENGFLSEEELSWLLLTGLTTSASAASPLGGNYEHSPDAAEPSLLDEAAERALSASSATTANGAIMIDTTPVATLASPLVVPAAAFTPDGWDPDSAFFSFTGGYWAGSAANYGCLIAPAALPRGVTVTDMFASVYDDDASRSITVTLRRVDNFSGVGVSMANAATSGQFNGVQTISTATIASPTVVYPDYSYFVTSCLGSSSLRLYSVRLYFNP